jgi:hypothetical protein
VFLCWRCFGFSRDVECPARTDANVSSLGADNLVSARSWGGASGIGAGGSNQSMSGDGVSRE